MSTYEGGTTESPKTEREKSHKDFLRVTDSMMDFTLKGMSMYADYVKSAELLKSKGMAIPTNRKEYLKLLDTANDITDEILAIAEENSKTLISLFSKSMV